MFNETSFWGEDAFDDLGIGERKSKGVRKDALRLRQTEIGRTVCFGGKDSAPAPAPDPMIGQSAMMNTELGKDWLAFSKEQFAQGSERQNKTDALIGQVAEQQINGQKKADSRSDQQWGDYNSLYRPIERMNVIDALGGQNLSDDQVRELIGKQNTSQAAALKAEYEQNIAAISGRSGGSTSTTKGQGVSRASAEALADSILKNGSAGARTAPQAAPTPALFWSGGEEGGGYQPLPGAPAVQSAAAAQPSEAELAASRDSLVKQLMGMGAQDGTTTTINLTPEERTSLLAAEKLRYEGALAGMGDVTDQVMMGRDADRKAQVNAAAEAKADVLGSADQQRQTSQRQMASMGINPNSGRFAGITRAGDLNTALASAGAQNNARTMVRNMGVARRADQANYGRGGSSVAAQQAGIGMTSGSAAVGNNQSGNQNFYQNNGVMAQGYQGAIGANTNAAGIMSNLYGNQLSSWNSKNQADATSAAGTGQMIGTVVGAGAAIFL